MPKKVYFIRHGETDGNSGPFIQGANSDLNDLGIKQVELVANKFRSINFDKLISSTYNRAIQTAEGISKHTNKDIIFSDLFIERIRPSEQVGKDKKSESYLSSEREYELNFKKGKKYKDGESFVEIINRAKKALNFIDQQDGKDIVIVTHGIFLKVLIAHLLIGDNLNPEICMDIMKNFKTKNTGITIIEKNKRDRWQIVTWNDHGHMDFID